MLLTILDHPFQHSSSLVIEAFFIVEKATDILSTLQQKTVNEQIC